MKLKIMRGGLNQEVGREEGAESPWALLSAANGDAVEISPSE